MRQAMTVTDMCPGEPAKLWDDPASSLYEAKSTYSAELRPLYTLFLVLYLLFWTSVQDLAACNLNFDLRTAVWSTTNLWEVSCHSIKKKTLLAVAWAQFMRFSFVLFTLFTIISLLFAVILIISKIRNSIWVCILPDVIGDSKIDMTLLNDWYN